MVILNTNTHVRGNYLTCAKTPFILNILLVVLFTSTLKYKLSSLQQKTY